MATFIGRENELQALNEAYGSRQSSFIPIYGRRRVGKSELILRFLKDKPGIYFSGKKAPAALQIREFLQESGAALNQPLLASLPSEDWKEALQAVVSQAAKNTKLVLVFDEFQWTAAASPELPSVLQEQWDRRWRTSGNILLILCGSYVGFMEREVLGRQSPLFGRRTAQIFLKPFGYREAAKFHPQYSLVNRAKAYFVCGGVPLYLRYFSSDVSVDMNLSRNLLSEYAPLFREPDFLLREELREVENYYAILLAVASGQNTNLSISKHTGIGERSLHYYLQQLVDLGYLSRRYPLTGKPPAARHVRYVFEDPLLRFWFRFVYPNTSFIQQRGPERALKDRIRPHLEGYWGECFERLCREALSWLYAREGIVASFEVGEYWDKATQIDVVGLRDDGWTDLGECKWGLVSSTKRLETEIEEKVARYPNERNATIGRRLFVRQAGAVVRKDSSTIRWHTLEDLYA